MHATTVTVHVNRLRECACADDASLAEFDSYLPGYIARLTAAMPAGVSLEIDSDGTGSLSSLSDNHNNELAYQLRSIEFWG